MKVGQTIRVLRTASKISQGALARRVKVTPGYLSLVEQDKREPSLSFLERVGSYFDVPVGFLLIGSANSHRTNFKHRRLIHRIEHAMLNYVISRPESARLRKSKLATS